MEHDFDLHDECCKNCHMPRYALAEFPTLAVCGGKADPLFTSFQPPDVAESEEANNA